MSRANLVAAKPVDTPGGSRAPTESSGSPSLRRRYGKAATWNAAAAVLTQGATFLTNILIANLLGRELFGQYSIVQSTLLTIAGIAQLATGLTATRYVAELRSDDKPRTGRILGLCSTVALLAGAVATAALALGSSWLASTVLKVPQAAQGLMVAAAFVLFSVMNSYQTGALAGLESFQTLARLGAVSGVVQLVTSVGLALWWGVDGALLGLALAAVVRWWLHARAISREAAALGIHVTRRGLRKERAIFLRFALPAAMGGISTLPALWLANAFLVRQQNGLAEMAIFAAANNLRVLVLFVPNLLNSVGMSLLNSQLATGNRAQYSKVFWMNVVLTSGTTLGAAIIVAIVGSLLLRLYGQGFALGYPVLLVLLVATLFEGMALGPYQIVQSHERMWFSLFFIAFPRDLSLVVLAYFLTPQHGAVGLACAYALAWLLAATSISFSAHRIHRRVLLTERSPKGTLR